MIPLTKSQRQSARNSIVLYFALILVIVNPVLKQFLMQNGFSYSDDPRINIKRLIKKRRFNGLNQLGKKTLEKALKGVNSVCHLDIEEIHLKGKFYLNCWERMCRQMGNPNAATALALYSGPMARTTAPTVQGNTPDDRILKQALLLFKEMVLTLTEALNSYMDKMKLPRNDDPYEILKMMKKDYAILFGIDAKDIVEKSFDGRISVCHFYMDKIENDHQTYLESWMKLCMKMKERDAVNKLRNSWPTLAKLGTPEEQN